MSSLKRLLQPSDLWLSLGLYTEVNTYSMPTFVPWAGNSVDGFWSHRALIFVGNKDSKESLISKFMKWGRKECFRKEEECAWRLRPFLSYSLVNPQYLAKYSAHSVSANTLNNERNSKQVRILRTWNIRKKGGVKQRYGSYPDFLTSSPNLVTGMYWVFWRHLELVLGLLNSPMYMNWDGIWATRICKLPWILMAEEEDKSGYQYSEYPRHMDRHNLTAPELPNKLVRIITPNIPNPLKRHTIPGLPFWMATDLYGLWMTQCHPPLPVFQAF